MLGPKWDVYIIVLSMRPRDPAKEKTERLEDPGTVGEWLQGYKVLLLQQGSRTYELMAIVTACTKLMPVQAG